MFHNKASTTLSITYKIRKILYYARVYGITRTMVKVIARRRIIFPLPWLLAPLKFNRKKNVAIVGCGQFSFSTIAFFLTKKFGKCIAFCKDVDPGALAVFSRCYLVPSASIGNIEDHHLKGVNIAYIASNHASHTDYALFFLKRDIDVYIEKPISVSYAQLNALKTQISQSKAKVYFGYNRPFSAAIQELISLIRAKPITLNCTVIGHLIPSDHWYRKPDEGTRICGNLGHWIDLALHLINARGGAEFFDVTIAYSDQAIPDDNLTISLTTGQHDLITLTLSAREEPFTGIQETIVFQQDGLYVKIDDFKKAEFYLGSKKFTKKYKPKDVGHEKAVLQPFSAAKRCSQEVFRSTELMLFVTDMVRNRHTSGLFRYAEDALNSSSIAEHI